jgi:hypothetical protein
MQFDFCVLPHLKGKATLVRFADDFVMTFEIYQDAKRVMDVVGKRFGRFGLTLHPDKTRFLDFRPQRHGGTPPDCKAEAFDFPGFTHSWGKSRKGKDVVRQTTAKSRFARSLTAVKDWCRSNASARTRAACQAVSGTQRPLWLLWHHREHPAATGLSPSSREDLAQMASSPNARMDVHMGILLRVSRSPRAAKGQDHSPIHLRERNSRAKNWMRQSRTSRSVGGEGGNVLAYPAPSQPRVMRGVPRGPA